MDTNCSGCISFDSYIKPQLHRLILLIFSVVYLLTPTSNHNSGQDKDGSTGVVYLLTPTSNHNAYDGIDNDQFVVYLLTPTSNHNELRKDAEEVEVVYLLTPTSNHNLLLVRICNMMLYIF